MTPEKMNPWMPITDIRLCAILNKGGEELNELGKVLCRALMQGLDGIDPKTGQFNLTALREEIADVRGLLAAICEELEFNGDDQELMRQRSEQKFANVKHWLDMIAPWGQKHEARNPANIYQKRVYTTLHTSTPDSYARTGECLQTDILKDWKRQGVPLIRRKLEHPPKPYNQMTVGDLRDHVDAPYARCWRQAHNGDGQVTIMLLYGSDPAIAELPVGPSESWGKPNPEPDKTNYETWIAKGRELYEKYDGSDAGLAAWHGWSADAYNYDHNALDEKWASFREADHG